MFDMAQNIPLDYLSNFAGGSEGYTGFFDICQTDYSIQSEFRIFSLFRSHTWKYNIQVNKRLTKVKSK